MKHAKKLLAIVMVLSMVAAFSVLAFAADPSVSCSVGEYKDGKATVTICLNDCVGLTSGSLSFAYEAGKITKVLDIDGADKELAGKCGNAFSSEINKDANPMEYGFYFKNDLYDAAGWAEAASDYEVDGTVNANSFECLKLKLTAETGTVVTVTGELKIGPKDAAVSYPVNTSFKIGPDPVLPTEPASQEPASQEPASQEPASQEPASQEPASQEPASQEPASQEPASQEPASQEPVTDSNAKYDKYGNKILGYDKNGKAIIGYTKNNQPIYSQDKSAHKGVILDVEPNNNGKSFVGDKDKDPTKPGDKDKDSTCTTAKAGKTTANVKTDAGKNTGDNSVLAIVAGVIALAGAAYVVTKKRK